MIEEINRRIDSLLENSRKKRRRNLLIKVSALVLVGYSAAVIKVDGRGGVDEAGVANHTPVHTAANIPTTLPLNAQDSIDIAGAEKTPDEFEFGLDTLLPSPDAAESTVANLTFQKKDSLAAALARAGVERGKAKEIADFVRKKGMLASVQPGQELEVSGVKNWAGALEPEQIAVNVSSEKRIVISKLGNKFTAEEVNVPLKHELFYASGVVKGSFYETAVKMGVPANRMSDLVNLFRYDVDFQRQVKVGDTFEVIIEKFYNEDGKLARFGKILYTALNLGDDKYAYYYYSAPDGTGDFYNSTGENIRKALLKTPISAARISSGCGMRHHPVLGYTRMHRGVDFAASTGTPILSAGDGTVSKMGRMGGYGNYLRVKHSDKYSTAYGHISRYAPGIKAGSQVKQGQVIAYVGSTGVSSGPHLHFEVLVDNDQVNPLNVKFASGKKLAGKDLDQFKAMTGNIDTYLASLPKPGEPTKLASNSAAR